MCVCLCTCMSNMDLVLCFMHGCALDIKVLCLIAAPFVCLQVLPLLQPPASLQLRRQSWMTSLELLLQLPLPLRRMQALVDCLPLQRLLMCIFSAFT